MTAYNVEKITKIEVSDFRETSVHVDLIPTISTVIGGVLYLNPRVTLYFDGVDSEFHYFKTLEAAEEFARRITMSKGWITITDEP